MVGEEIEEIRENLSHLECYLTSLRATTDTRLARLERLGPWSFPLPESRSFLFPSFSLGDIVLLTAPVDFHYCAACPQSIQHPPPPARRKHKIGGKDGSSRSSAL
jgi:hypothetical protein